MKNSIFLVRTAPTSNFEFGALDFSFSFVMYFFLISLPHSLLLYFMIGCTKRERMGTGSIHCNVLLLHFWYVDSSCFSMPLKMEWAHYNFITTVLFSDVLCFLHTHVYCNVYMKSEGMHNSMSFLVLLSMWVVGGVIRTGYY